MFQLSTQNKPSNLSSSGSVLILRGCFKNFVIIIFDKSEKKYFKEILLTVKTLQYDLKEQPTRMSKYFDLLKQYFRKLEYEKFDWRDNTNW